MRTGSGPPSRHGPEGAGAAGRAAPERERAQAYRWLSGIFARETSAEALMTYRAPGGVALLDGFGAHPSLAPLAATLRGLALDHENPETVAKDLADAFARLFLGVGGRRSAPPYESAYTSERGLLFQEASGHSAAQLVNLGLQVSGSFPEPPDHLAVQLEIVAELARRREESDGTADAGKYADRRLAFLENRLLPWLPAFRDDCAAFDRSGFYATAAGCLVAFVTADAERLRVAQA